MNVDTNPRHIIARTLDRVCDKLHPEQAREIIAALDAAGLQICDKPKPRESDPNDWDHRGVNTPLNFFEPRR